MLVNPWEPIPSEKKNMLLGLKEKKKSLEEIGGTPITLPSGKTLPLESFASIKKVYNEESTITIGHIENQQRDS